MTAPETTSPSVTISAAAATDDRLATLKAMRTKLAADMDIADPNVSAQLAARLQSVLAEIAELSVPVRRTLLDDLEKRRADRLATAEPVEPAKRPTRQRRTGSG